MNNLVCYVSHYTKLTERRANLTRQLSDIKLPVIWLTEYDREKITPEHLRKYIAANFKTNIRCDWEAMPADQIAAAHFAAHMSYRANAIAHLSALEQTARETRDCLVIEDDLIFKPNFITNLNACLDNLPEDWDLVFLSDGCDLHAPNITPSQTLYKMSSSRCASCYLVRNQTAKRLATSMIPLSEEIDHAYTRAIRQHNLNAYWAEPTLAYEGSKTGIFTTSTWL